MPDEKRLWETERHDDIGQVSPVVLGIGGIHSRLPMPTQIDGHDVKVILQPLRDRDCGPCHEPAKCHGPRSGALDTRCELMSSLEPYQNVNLPPKVQSVPSVK